jgi:hypothetical protein
LKNPAAITQASDHGRDDIKFPPKGPSYLNGSGWKKKWCGKCFGDLKIEKI